MKTRTLLATATLTALLLSLGTLQPMPIHGTADSSYALQLAEDSTGPQWAYAWGMGRGWGFVFSALGALVCSGFSTPAGGIACGLTGAA